MASTPENSEEVFEDGPWAQKFMFGVDKKAAKQAASRAKKTIPEWLSEAIREKVTREREPSTPPAKPSLLTLNGTADAQVHLLEPIALNAEEIWRSIEVAQKIRALRGGELRPNAKILIAAERALRSRFPP